jgi:hypothetical protein
MVDIPDAVYGLWITGLVLVLLVVPGVVYHLFLLLQTARQVEHYTADMLTAGLGIAGNTQHIAALESTIQVATGILNTAGAIDEHAGAIEHLLASRVTLMADS